MMNMRVQYPPWVILHVPHDSLLIPSGIRRQITLTDGELDEELVRMTDHLTLPLFASGTPETQVIRAPASRLVVDVERFEDDHEEPMAGRGMGAVYSVTSSLKPLRRPLSDVERDALMLEYYHPHHARLEAAVSTAVDLHGRCLVIDCHSFPSVALPYELVDPALTRPDICIGTDAFHTSSELASAFVSAFQREQWSVSLNEPFAGALVPRSRYQRDQRVNAVMVEINRSLYLREQDATPLSTFEMIAERVRNCCMAAIATCEPPGDKAW
jgi:N-formylglutamate amidohydrolase